MPTYPVPTMQILVTVQLSSYEFSPNGLYEHPLLLQRRRFEASGRFPTQATHSLQNEATTSHSILILDSFKQASNIAQGHYDNN